MKTLLSKEEVAVAVGVSYQTINIWYKFKEENPDNEYAKILPEPITIGRQKMWSKTSINDLRKFKNTLPKGRNGIMGSVTQRYLRKT